jgi:hypothetical protein
MLLLDQVKKSALFLRPAGEFCFLASILDSSHDLESHTSSPPNDRWLNCTEQDLSCLMNNNDNWAGLVTERVG